MRRSMEVHDAYRAADLRVPRLFMLEVVELGFLACRERRRASTSAMKVRHGDRPLSGAVPRAWASASACYRQGDLHFWMHASVMHPAKTIADAQLMMRDAWASCCSLVGHPTQVAVLASQIGTSAST
jgi:hypothetical protein